VTVQVSVQTVLLGNIMVELGVPTRALVALLYDTPCSQEHSPWYSPHSPLTPSLIPPSLPPSLPLELLLSLPHTLATTNSYCGKGLSSTDAQG